MSLTPNCLTDVLDDLARVGEATGKSQKAEQVIGDLQQRISAVRDRIAQSSTRPRVACLEWFDPIYAAGHWVPDMVELAGGHDVLGRKGEPSAKIDWNKVIEVAPEMIVLMPCGFDVSQTLRGAPALKQLEGWHELPAVKAGKVYAVNGHAFFSRPGPRLVDGLELLAHTIHPEILPMRVSPDQIQKIA